MNRFIQAHRLLSVTTPLGKDVLLLDAFHGTEEISGLFHFTLECFSEKEDIKPQDIVGKAVSWSVRPEAKESRKFHGVVQRFVAGPRLIHGLRAYRAEVVPWLWFLTRTTDCRIFQKKTVPAILKAVFADFGFTDYQFNLRRDCPEREYCVQYRESDFAFVARLLEEEGIFWFFQHEEGKHTLVLADQKSAYVNCPQKVVDYEMDPNRFGRVNTWEHQYEFRSGKWAQTDYNFETPATDLLTNSTTVVPVPDSKKYEQFDYPGVYRQKGDGADLTKLRMEEEEVGYDTVTGSGSCLGFTPGGKFTLRTPSRSPEGDKEYVLVSVRHEGRDASYPVGGPARQGYENAFTCIPSAVVFRPARRTPRPVVQGPQTAVVVGPKGEEIYTDRYGRVKVQFFWDRLGKSDENSSCWIRVAQNWAGKNWGAVFHPRVGQEVVVDFLEGNPDRPLITGRVYNAEQMPPYELPKNQTQSTLKSRSSKDGGATNFNELRFEDRKGSEQVFLHAEKDMDWRVKNDSREFVGKDRHLIVKGSLSVSVEKDEHVQVKGERREKVGKDLSQQVGGKRQDKVGGNWGVDGGQEIHIKAGTNLILEAGAEVTIKAGGNFIHIGPSGVAISGTQVLINSGGAAGSGGGSSPQDPKDPDVADDGTKVGKLN
jgi:type VI secretion system secreted protein VgrG